MANPTQDQLITLITDAIRAVTPSTGSLSDTHINESVKETINVFDNLDPDRPVKVRNLQRA